jgi:hypothetical protein
MQLPDHATFPVIAVPFCVRLRVVAQVSVSALVEPASRTFVGPHAPVRFGPTVTDALGRAGVQLARR